MRLTIYDLAKKAGVSIATVSRALNDETRGKVAPETLRKIEKIAAAHQYTPHFAARQLTQTSYKTIGVLLPHHSGILRSDYYSNILSGVADQLLESDFRMKMILLKPEKPKWDRYDFKNGEGVDGLIMTYWHTFFQDQRIFSKLKIPCVVINNAEKGTGSRFVAGEHFEGGRLAAEYLCEHGHREVGVFSGPLYSPDIQERFAGFQAGLKTNGLTLKKENIIDVDFDEERSYQKTDDFLDSHPKVTALFCLTDASALGVLRRLDELGGKCPARLSVIGYDDDPRAKTSRPGLTTIRVPVYDLARQAAQDLLAEIAKPSGNRFNQVKRLGVTLVERASVKKR